MCRNGYVQSYVKSSNFQLYKEKGAILYSKMFSIYIDMIWSSINVAKNSGEGFVVLSVRACKGPPPF